MVTCNLTASNPVIGPQPLESVTISCRSSIGADKLAASDVFGDAIATASVSLSSGEEIEAGASIPLGELRTDGGIFLEGRLKVGLGIRSEESNTGGGMLPRSISSD